MTEDPSVAGLLERLNAVEARLDPAPLRRGRVVGDVVTILIVVPLAAILDLEFTRPAILLSLMALAVGLHRLIPHIARTSLRRERDRLSDEIAALRGPE